MEKLPARVEEELFKEFTDKGMVLESYTILDQFATKNYQYVYIKAPFRFFETGNLHFMLIEITWDNSEALKGLYERLDFTMVPEQTFKVFLKIFKEKEGNV